MRPQPSCRRRTTTLSRGVQSPDAYEENALPPTGSDIWIPENGTLTVSSESDYAFLGTMVSVRPQKGSVLTCSVAAGQTNTLACAVYVTADNSAWAVGTLRKVGAGTLALTSANVDGKWGERADYNVNMDVQGGTVALYPQTDMAGKIVALRSVSVGTDGVFEAPGHARLSLWQLNGEGVVRNDNAAMNPTTLTFSNTSPGGAFGGRIVGNFGLRVEGRQDFSGVDSPFGGASVVTICGYAGGSVGICGLGAMAGSKAEPGLPTSIGLDYLNLGVKGNPADSGSTAYLRYLGSGETVSKTLFLTGWHTGVPYVFDAGETGGWKFSGGAIRNTAAANLHVVLTGSNATESVMATGVFLPSQDGCVVQFTKRDPGVWKLAESGSGSALGLVAVEEGTLRYDTLRDKGRHCALGAAETLFDGLVGPADEARRVPYAVRLGGVGTTNAVFEYVGQAAACTATRPIALGAGVSHIRSSGAGPLKLRGVGGVTADAHELVLDGANSGDNILSTVTNGQGVVSVTKAGAGTWTLAGEQSWTGALSVKGGTLNLLSPHAYSYFKLVLKETLWGCSRYADYVAEKGEGNANRFQVALGEFALCSADGRRQNVGFADGLSVEELAPGEAAFGADARPAADANYPWYNRLFPLFNGRGFVNYDKDGVQTASSTEFYCNNPGNRDFSLDDPTSWLSIVVRLTNATPAIAT